MEEKYVKVLNGDLADNVYRLVTTSDSGDILGVKVSYGEPTIYVRKEDVEYVSREEFEAKNKNTLNNAEYLKL